MAGSRVEKFGTIYSRLRGLLRSGAVKESDKPMWYDIYEAFPPVIATVKPPPPPERARHQYQFNKRRPRPSLVPTRPSVRTVLYHEDAIRAKFYERFGNPEVVDLTSNEPTICQRFVEEYTRQQQDGVEDGELLFERTTRLLNSQGIRLYTRDDSQTQQKQQHHHHHEEGIESERRRDQSTDQHRQSVLGKLIEESVR